MNITSQKETWSNFKKLTLYISLILVAILILMAFFLL